MCSCFSSKERLIFTYFSRDEAHHRMQSLRERSERDLTQFTSELKDLLRVIDHDKKLRDFMNTKMEERGELYEAAVQGRKEKKMIDQIKVLQLEVEQYEDIFQQLVEVIFEYTKERSTTLKINLSKIFNILQTILKIDISMCAANYLYW